MRLASIVAVVGLGRTRCFVTPKIRVSQDGPFFVTDSFDGIVLSSSWVKQSMNESHTYFEKVTILRILCFDSAVVSLAAYTVVTRSPGCSGHSPR